MVPLNQGQLFAARAVIQAVKMTGEEFAPVSDKYN